MSNIAQCLNVYYTAGDSNPSTASQAIQAQIDEKLIYPIIKDASQFQVGLVKSKVPLDTIPLTKSNIPLKAYDITLRKGSSEGSAYVEQVNARESVNFLWKCSGGTISQFTYSSTGVVSAPILSVDYSFHIPYINQFVLDDYSNVYAIGSSVPGGVNNLFGVFSFQASPTVYFKQTFPNINCICIDRTARVFLGEENDGVFVYQSVPTQSGTTLTLIETITEDFSGNPLTEITSVCADINIVVGYATNKVQIYSSEYVPLSSSITIPEIVQLSTISAMLHDQDTFCLVDEGQNIDVIYGVNSAGVCNNVQTGVSYFQGLWSQTSCPRLQTSQLYATGIGELPGKALYWIPNSSTAAPINIFPTNTFKTNCADPFNNWYGTDSEGGLQNILYTNDNFYFNIMAQDFQQSSTNSFISMDSHKSNNLLYGVGQDGKLYASNQPVVPIHLFTSPTGENAGTTFQRSDYSMPLLNQNQQMTYTAQYQAFNGLISAGGYNLLGLYQTAFGYIACGVIYNTGVTPYSSPLKIWRLDSNFNVLLSAVLPAVTFLGGAPVTMFRYGIEGTTAMLGIYDSTGQCTFINETTLAMVVDMVHSIPFQPLGQSVTNGGLAICATGTHIYWSNGNTINVQGFNTTTNTWVTTVSNCALTLSDGASFYPQSFWVDEGYATRIFAVGQGSNGLGNLQLYIIDLSALIGPPTVTATIVGPFINPNLPYSPTVNYTVAQKYPFSPGAYNDAYNLIQGIPFQKVIYIPNNDSNGFDIFQYDLSLQPGTLTYVTSTLLDYQPAVLSTGIPFVFYLNANSTGMYTYTQNIPTNLDTTLSSICFSLETTNICYASTNAGVVYKGTLQAGAIQNFTAIPNEGNVSYKAISVGGNFTPNSSINCYRLSNQTLINDYALGLTSVLGLSPNTFTGNYTCCTEDTSGNFLNFPGNTLLPPYFTTTITNPGSIYTKNSEDVDAGPADIFTYQVLIDAINRAFVIAFNRANINNAGLINAPTVSMDFQTGLCTLNYDSEYTNSANGILTKTDGIIFNTNLYNLLRFYGQKDTSQYASPGDYLLLLSTGSGTGPFSALQTSKSITTFNRLDKILFQSNSIYVAQSYFGNNQVNQVITDIDVDTSTLIEMEGQWLLYQPNFIRPFILASNNAIDRIQLSVYYSYIDGTSYPLFINPGSGWNVKLDFFRKFGF